MRVNFFFFFFYKFFLDGIIVYCRIVYRRIQWRNFRCIPQRDAAVEAKKKSLLHSYVVNLWNSCNIPEGAVHIPLTSNWKSLCTVWHRREFGGLCHVVLPLLGSAGLDLLLTLHCLHTGTTVVDAESNVFQISIYTKPQQFLDNLIVIALLPKRFCYIPSLSSELCCDFSALFSIPVLWNSNPAELSCGISSTHTALFCDILMFTSLLIANFWSVL